MSTPSGPSVLVTGGSGFIAGHCLLRLLDEGYRVRTTVRSLAGEAAVREVLTAAGMRRGEALEFVAADLTADEGWDAATAGVDFVLHVASPVHLAAVADEDEVIVPARDGALRVLSAAHRAGVRRVVLTSAFHAVGFGQPHDHAPFTESDWSPLHGPGMDAYGRSKVLAERAAWAFAAEHPDIELTTLLPVAVMGPVLGEQISGSNHIVQQLLRGKLPGYPNLYLPIVDVRDVAAAHVAAMTVPRAAGERYLIAAGEPAMAMSQVGALLRQNLGGAAAKVPTRRIPNVVLRVAARFNSELRGPVADLGFVKDVRIDKARRELGFAPRPSRDAVVAAGRSLVQRGLAG